MPEGPKDEKPQTTGKGQLVYDGEVIWENPEGLGYAGIKLRKQIHEEALAGEMRAKRLLTEIENTSYTDPRELKAKLLEAKVFIIIFLRKHKPHKSQKVLLRRYYAQVDRLQDMPAGMKIDTNELIITDEELS